jgi:hypothetical protein
LKTGGAHSFNVLKRFLSVVFIYLETKC